MSVISATGDVTLTHTVTQVRVLSFSSALPLLLPPTPPPHFSTRCTPRAQGLPCCPWTNPSWQPPRPSSSGTSPPARHACWRPSSSRPSQTHSRTSSPRATAADSTRYAATASLLHAPPSQQLQQHSHPQMQSAAAEWKEEAAARASASRGALSAAEAHAPPELSHFPATGDHPRSPPAAPLVPAAATAATANHHADPMAQMADEAPAADGPPADADRKPQPGAATKEMEKAMEGLSL